MSKGDLVACWCSISLAVFYKEFLAELQLLHTRCSGEEGRRDQHTQTDYCGLRAVLRQPQVRGGDQGDQGSNYISACKSCCFKHAFWKCLTEQEWVLDVVHWIYTKSFE